MAMVLARCPQPAARRLVVPILFALLLAAAPPSHGQPPDADLLLHALRPPAAGGVVVVDRSLARLAGHRRLLMIGAHPDDEDTALLAHVVWDLGGEAAYLSLSRGDGGQNLIGGELGVGLGLLRSRELQAARERDGARQFFSRAFDFGFSRSLAETLRRWDREVLLTDAVRAIRSFRPQVVVSVFPPTPVAGHGQHQAAGWVAEHAFRLAGDPAAYPELAAEGLSPWQPAALYREVYADPESRTLVVPLRGGDVATGRSTYQIAMASRSAHASQDMGRIEELGHRDRPLAWLAGGAGPEGATLFAGVDPTLAGLLYALAGAPSTAPAAPAAAAHRPSGDTAGGAGPGGAQDGAAATRLLALRDRLMAIERVAAETRATLVPSRLAASVPALAGLVAELRAARAEARALPAELVAAEARATLAAMLREREQIASTALAAAAGVVLEAWSESETVVAGAADATGATKVSVQVWASAGTPAVLSELAFELAHGWEVAGLDGGAGELAAGTLLLREGTLRAPRAAPSAPDFVRGLVSGPAGDLYDWRALASAERGRPFAAPEVVVRATLEIAGVPVELRRAVVHRRVDQARGEVRRPLRVLPAVEVKLPAAELVLVAGSAPRLAVELAAHTAADWEGTLEITAPAGWAVQPAVPVKVPGGGVWRGELPLVAPAATERPVAVGVVALGGRGERFDAAFPLIEYPHIAPVVWPRPAVASVSLVDAALPRARSLAYLRGASDRIPEVLAELGVPFTLVSGADLAEGDLERFGVIVLGPRAYETEPALADANRRLLDWARAGGVLIVQYQQYGFVQAGQAPYPLPIARPHDRVTDEGAPVHLLVPEHPVFHVPNRLGPADWDGWVQERGLYFARDPAPEYRRLLAIDEPEVGALDGGLLDAPLGKGRYVYTGLAFFRQLPAGVPGAVRLFLNLLDLEPAAAASAAVAPSAAGGPPGESAAAARATTAAR